MPRRPPDAVGFARDRSFGLAVPRLQPLDVVLEALVLRRFRLGKELLVAQIGRAFERGEGRVVPNTLQIRVAVGGARNRLRSRGDERQRARRGAEAISRALQTSRLSEFPPASSFLRGRRTHTSSPSIV